VLKISSKSKLWKCQTEIAISRYFIYIYLGLSNSVLRIILQSASVVLTIAEIDSITDV